ncbi:MAG: hypothetical protein AAGD06_19770 [Acidobacteriota bacterium]
MDHESWPRDLSGDLSFEMLRPWADQFFGVRRLGASWDGSWVVATTEEGWVVLHLNGGQIEIRGQGKTEEPIDQVFFAADSFWLVEEESIQRVGLPEPGEEATAETVPGLPGALWGASLLGQGAAPRALLVDTDAYGIYDLEHHDLGPHVQLPFSSELAPQDPGAGVWLFPDGELFVHSPEHGLRSAHLVAELPAVMESGQGSLFTLQYRQGLLGPNPKGYLLGFSHAREAQLTYWIEQHGAKHYLVSLSRRWTVEVAPGAGAGAGEGRRSARRPTVRYLELPDDFRPYDLGPEALEERLAEFRKVTPGIETQVNLDFMAMAQDFMPEMFRALQGRHRVAFDGTFAVYPVDGGIQIRELETGDAWDLDVSQSRTLVAFRPFSAHQLVVWAEHRGVELWDLVHRRRIREIPLGWQGTGFMALDGRGRRLAVGSPTSVRVLDLESEETLWQHQVDLEQAGRIFSIDVDRPGRRLLMAGLDLDGEGSDLGVVDLDSGGLSWHLAGGVFGFFSDAVFQDGGPHILETSPLSREVRFYRLDDDGVEHALTVVVAADGEAAVFDRHNRYWSTLEGRRQLQWRYGSSLAQVGQLREAFFCPAELAALLRGGEARALRALAAPPPRLELVGGDLSPFATAVVADRLGVDLAVLGTAPVVEVQVSVNGAHHSSHALSTSVPSAGRRAGDEPPGEVCRGFPPPPRQVRRADAEAVRADRLQVEVTGLRAGPSRVTFTALDAHGNTSSALTLPIDVQTPSAEPPSLYYLGIGAERDLRFARADALWLGDLVSKMPRAPLWGAVVTRVLEPGEVTPEGIQSALAELAAAAGPRDLVIVYLAGHGARNPRLSLSTNSGWLGFERLAEALGEIEARTLVLLDTCHAAAAASAGGVGHDRMVAELAAGRRRGLQVLAASRSWEQTYEWTQEKHSNFALAIAEAFEPTSDLDRDGYVSLRELEVVVAREADRRSRRYFRDELDRVVRQAGERFSWADRSDEAQALDSHHRMFWQALLYPHRPWMPNPENLGDIPLISVGDRQPP